MTTTEDIKKVAVTVAWVDPSYGTKRVNFQTDLYSNPASSLRRKNMKSTIRIIHIRRGEGILRNERGLVLPIALIFLVILSIMGIAAIMTSTSTTAVFGGLRRADEALYYAEAGY